MPHSLFAALVSPSLLLLLVLSLYASTSHAQANRTVDDFSPEITYSPAANVTHTDTTGFDMTKLYNGTIGLMNGTDNAVNMTLSFTGTAIWLFTAKPQTSHDSSFTDGYTVYLDGKQVDEDAEVDLESDAEYANVAYSNDQLPSGAHIVTLSADSGTPLYFDYAIFTSNDPTPETTIPPVQPPSSASGASIGKPKSTSPAAPATSQSGGALKAKSHIAVIAGAAAAVVLLLGAGIAVCIFLRRRRARVTPQHYSTGGGKVGAGYSGGQGQGQPVYGAEFSVAQTSEAALFCVPTSVSQHSNGSTPPSMPLPMPLPPTQNDAHNPYQFQAQGQYGQYPPQSQYQPQLQSQSTPQPQSQYSPPPQSQYIPQPHSQPQSHYASPEANAEPGPYPPHSQSPFEHQPQDQDPFGYIQPQSVAVQRMLAEQRTVEAEYAPPQAWVVDAKGQAQANERYDLNQFAGNSTLAQQQAYQPQHNHNQFSRTPVQVELEQQQQYPALPRDPRALRYEQPHNPNLERVMEKHRVAEAEYAQAHARTATGWPDEKRGGLDVSRTPTRSSQGSPPTRSHSVAASGAGSTTPDTYPPSPSSAGSSSSAHGAAALSTIAAEMAALRAQVARLEGERREEQPPAYI